MGKDKPWGIYYWEPSGKITEQSLGYDLTYAEDKLKEYYAPFIEHSNPLARRLAKFFCAAEIDYGKRVHDWSKNDPRRATYLLESLAVGDHRGLRRAPHSPHEPRLRSSVLRTMLGIHRRQ